MRTKIILTILAAVTLLLAGTPIFATTNCPPKGHHSYVKHQKHHKAHHVHKLHGRIDATYQN